MATVPGNYGVPNHVLYTYSGDLPGGENWSIGLRTGPSLPTAAELQILANYAHACFTAFWISPGCGADWNAPGTTYTGCTARALNLAGVTQELAVASTIPGAASGSSSVVPDQIACVITLTTAMAGRHGKGRVYMPATGAKVLAGGVFDPAKVETLAAGFANLLDQHLGTNAGPALSVPPATFNPIAVQSRTSGVAGAPVTGIGIGSIPDTIRGRRQKLKETYVTKRVY